MPKKEQQKAVERLAWEMPDGSRMGLPFGMTRKEAEARMASFPGKVVVLGKK